jgi:AcrR family transcriptional regulator
MGTLRGAREKVDQVRLVEAAVALVNRGGLDALSMNELASALGVRTPSLYSHVEGIDDVKRLLALHGLAEIDRRVSRIALGKSSADAVRAVVHAYRACALASPGVYMAALPTPPKGDRAWNAAKDRIFDTLRRVLHGFGFEGDEEIHATRGLRSLAHGFVSLELSGALKHPVDREESLEWLISVFIDGLEARAKQKHRRKTP